MSVIVFAGPSLAQTDRDAHPDFDVRPPVRQGDVYRAAQEAPAAIGIIDGYFDGVPSVWHKEILFALERGIAVIGGASMGALRALELEPFGMRGVGAIYDAYRSGEIEDDDEVAVLHGPVEAGYAAVSIPMVNVRATLQVAEEAGAINARLAAEIAASAKAIYYRDRTWEAVIDGLDKTIANALRRHEVDQKRLDARAVLLALVDLSTFDPPASEPVAPTHLFRRAVAEWDRGETDGISAEDGLVLEQWALAAPADDPLLLEARLRRALLEPRSAPASMMNDLSAAFERFRQRHGLWSRGEIDAFLAEAALDGSELEGLLRTEARADNAENVLPDLAPHMVAILKLAGRYGSLSRSAEERRNLKVPQIAAFDVEPLWHWFGEETGRDPEIIANHLERLGLAPAQKSREIVAGLIACERAFQEDRRGEK